MKNSVNLLETLVEAPKRKGVSFLSSVNNLLEVTEDAGFSLDSQADILDQLCNRGPADAMTDAELKQLGGVARTIRVVSRLLLDHHEETDDRRSALVFDDSRAAKHLRRVAKNEAKNSFVIALCGGQAQ